MFAEFVSIWYSHILPLQFDDLMGWVTLLLVLFIVPLAVAYCSYTTIMVTSQTNTRD